MPAALTAPVRLLLAAAALVALLLITPAADAKTKPRPKAKAAVECVNGDLAPTAENLPAVRAAILCLHNKIRVEHGLPSLKENTRLRATATGHSSEMIQDGYFAHDSQNGTSFSDRILAGRYVKRNAAWTLGENLAWGTGELSTPAKIMDEWMHSAGHRANILKGAYREIGIGIRLGIPTDATVGATVTADFGAKL